MSGSERRSSIHPPEAALAFLASVAFFLLGAAATPIRGHLVLILILVGVYMYVVLAAAQRRGPLYAVPLAIAGGLALDSFYIPPTRDFGADDWQNWLVVAAYLVVALLIGMIGGRAQRRAEAAEQARGLLAEEQAALRRVATLVARQAPPVEVFATVTGEVRRLLGVDVATMVRFEQDGTATVVGGSWPGDGTDGGERDSASGGTRLPLEGENVPSLVRRTGRPVRLDDYTKTTGPLGAYARNLGVRSAVGSPIVVEGRLWGSINAASRQGEPLPADTESRIGEFTELVATAIANIQARSELAASRARIVAATDAERRRVVRDLHDGAQQRLVHTILKLKLAERALQTDGDAAPALVTEAEVTAHVEDGTLAVHVRDDGLGGARPEGSGLVGLADRRSALDGELRVESPADGGTLIVAAIPLAG